MPAGDLAFAFAFARELETVHTGCYTEASHDNPVTTAQSRRPSHSPVTTTMQTRTSMAGYAGSWLRVAAVTGLVVVAAAGKSKTKSCAAKDSDCKLARPSSVCYKRKGVKVGSKQGCTCHPSCKTCGYGKHPESEDQCLTCAVKGAPGMQPASTCSLAPCGVSHVPSNHGAAHTCAIRPRHWPPCQPVHPFAVPCLPCTFKGAQACVMRAAASTLCRPCADSVRTLCGRYATTALATLAACMAVWQCSSVAV